jgi:hypothetical protein
VTPETVVGRAPARPFPALDTAVAGHISVSELQHALRMATGRTSAVDGVLPPPATWTEQGDRVPLPAPGWGARIDGGWVAVVAAHAGAGASTAALALADAAGPTRDVQLIDCARPAVSGLVAVASAELGLDVTGCWQRGTRGPHVAVDRPAAASRQLPWPPPAPSSPGRRPLTVVDLGHLRGDAFDTALGARGDAPAVVAVVLVCRVSVPGARQAEQALTELSRLGWPAVALAVGPPRWPGVVSASCGPLLVRMRAAGHVVTVPVDRKLEYSGPTAGPLPKPVLAAGRTLLALLDEVAPVRPPTAPAGRSTAGDNAAPGVTPRRRTRRFRQMAAAAPRAVRTKRETACEHR